MCSSVWLRKSGSAVLGVNYDFYFDDGLLVVNRRGADKFALSEASDRLTWKAVHGSVTLNQFGCELPTGGMNERGLCVHLLESDGDPYPENRESRPELIELQWIQYVLDTTSDVDAAIATLDRISLKQSFYRLQFALADARSGALIAPENGRFVVSRFAGSSAATNTPFERALASHRGRAARGARDSLRRFRKLYLCSQRVTESDQLVPYAFDALESVRVRPGRWARTLGAIFGQPRGMTVWQTVFVPRALEIHLRTIRDRRPKSLRLAALRFDADAQNRVWDLRGSAAGDLEPRLVPYDREINRDLIERVYASVEQEVITKDERRQLADYPEMFDYQLSS